MKQFKNWINEVAEYGLERESKKARKETPYDDPAPKYKIDYITEQLSRKPLGYKQSIRNFFFGEVQWGTDPGAVKITFSPFGGLAALTHKLEFDLKGEPVWICKHVLEVKHKYLENADVLIEHLSEIAEKVNQQQFDAPSADFEGTERLTLKLSHYLRKNTIQRILLYEGIKIVEPNKNYIIHFGCSGYGRQREGQKRLDQFQIQVVYERDRGVIKIAGNEIGDDIGKHRWQIDPSQFFEYFMPSQPEQEILESFLALLDSY